MRRFIFWFCIGFSVSLLVLLLSGCGGYRVQRHAPDWNALHNF